MTQRRKRRRNSSSSSFPHHIDLERYSKLDPSKRVHQLARTSSVFLVVQVIGFVAAAIVAIAVFFGWPKSIFGSLAPADLLFAPAYAAESVAQGVVFFKDLKSIILSGVFMALFVLFLWALYTLYRSPNPHAVGVAVEAVKTLSGFFVGALTGFLGA